MHTHTKAVSLRRRRIGQLLLLAAIPLLSVAVTDAESGAAATTIHGSTPTCNVTIDLTPAVDPTEAIAHIHSGCSTGDYWLTSWAASSNSKGQAAYPQTFVATTNHSPWEVPLPPCYWQVDFSQRSTAPGTPSPTHQTLVAAGVGGRMCPSPVTTTTLPTTTVTTTPGSTATTAPTTSTTLPTTSTTAPTTATTLPTTTTTAPGTSPSGGGTTTTVPGGTTTVPGGPPTTTGGSPSPSTPGGRLPGAAGSAVPVTAAQVPAAYFSEFPEARPAVAVPAKTGLLAFTGFGALLLLVLAAGAVALGLFVLRGSGTGRRASPRSGR